MKHLHFPMTITLLAAAVFLTTACATHEGYDTFQARDRGYEIGSIALADGGLTAEQIKAITATRITKEFPVDIALIVLKNGYIEQDQEEILVRKVISTLQASDKIARVIPILRFLLPKEISFSRIQELGIRTLSEYVLVLYLDARSLIQWTVILETEMQIESVVDYLLVDSQTTAIIAADKLYSTKKYRLAAWKPEEKEKAVLEIFTEQGDIMGKKMQELFR